MSALTPVMQPSPTIAPSGDCFACATLAMLRHFWPDEAAKVTVADVVDMWRDDEGNIRNVMPLSERVLRALPWPYRLDVHTDPFVPAIHSGFQQSEAWWFPASYAERVEAYLAAGWIGFTNIRLHPAQRMLSDELATAGSALEGGRMRTAPDHNVLITGRRDAWEPLTHIDGSVQRRYVEIVCSVKGRYEIDIERLIEFLGGLWILWCRPTAVSP